MDLDTLMDIDPKNIQLCMVPTNWTGKDGPSALIANAERTDATNKNK